MLWRIFPAGRFCVGLRTNFKALSKQGLKPFAVGAIGEVVIAAFTLGLVLVAQHWFS